MYNRPIPGQSLTATPRNSSYEQPPVIVDPKIAVQAHLKRLTKPKAMEDILLFIDAGVDIRTLVEGTLRGAVLEGIHSIDVSLIIAPVLHEFIRGIPLAAGVPFEEGFEDEEDFEEAIYKMPEPVEEVKKEMPEKSSGLMARK